ncbi:element excision factor XisH family protein [Microcystis aeruginosa]|uniref:element excision factor XisH family protein n=1 Tax=Microcystis aeruginosa TaxID=1126 RepID=UPI0009B7088D|nr:element excision factor XisH family protein [Microcystis aeruginosa]
MKYKDVELFADLAAEKPLAAERNRRKIVVEIKSFLILNPLSNAQKTGFSEKPVFYSCTHAKRGINNQSLITRFSISP